MRRRIHRTSEAQTKLGKMRRSGFFPGLCVCQPISRHLRGLSVSVEGFETFQPVLTKSTCATKLRPTTLIHSVLRWIMNPTVKVEGPANVN